MFSIPINFLPSLLATTPVVPVPKNGSNIFIEASGGITEKNLPSFINTGIDAISTGAITHSVINKDIKLEFI